MYKSGGKIRITYELLAYLLGIESGRIVRVIPSLEGDVVDIFHQDVDKKVELEEGRLLTWDMAEGDQYVQKNFTTYNSQEYFYKLWKDRVEAYDRTEKYKAMLEEREED